MANKIFRILVLAVLVVSVLCFAACADETNVDTSSNASKPTDKTDSEQTNSNDNVSSGIELEEDVFDDSAVSNTPSGDNTQSGNNTNNSTDKNNQSNSQTTNNSSNSTSSSTSTDNSSGEENNNSSETESIVEENDGTVKLPVDWF